MKILIADDESLVRQSIRLFWLELGIQPEDITEVSNGMSLIEALKNHYFDLALVDIQMPYRNGLDAIREAQDISPDTLFYILTGFDDFSYAREAVRLQVKDYLLKPIRRTELEEILEEVISHVEQKKARLIRELKLCIASLFSDGGPDLSSITFPILCHPLLITSDQPETVLSGTLFSEEADDHMIVIPYRRTDRLFLFLFETPEYPNGYAEFLPGFIKRYGNTHTIIEGKAFSNSSLWSSEYARMTSLASCRFLFGSSRFYKNTITAPELSVFSKEICVQCQNGLNAYSNGDYAGFSLAAEALVKELPRLGTESPANAAHLLSFLEHAYGINPGAELSGQFSRLASTMMRNTSRDFRYDEILKYLEQHYQEDLSLSSVAERFSLSPGYFSTIFKKKAGHNFVHYLTSLRIREAKRLLLETQMTISEVALAVGYSSASFFIRSFKKTEEISPSEYRKGKK